VIRLDREDRIFIKEVGKKAAKMLKQRNIRLWLAFKQRCQENDSNPETELGKKLLLFTKSLLEDESYASEILSKTIKVSALQRKSDITEDIKTLVEVRNMLKESSSSETDKLINKLLDKAFETTASPFDVMEKEEKIVIDDELLSQLTPEQLEQLAQAAKQIKEEKEALKRMKSEELIREIGGEIEQVSESEYTDFEDIDEEFEEVEEVEEVAKEEEGNDDSGEDKDSDRSAESSEELSERSG